MTTTYSGYALKNGAKLMYNVFENGFDIFVGESSSTPYMHQPEPFIPNPDKTYEENAIEMCKNLSERSNQEPEKPFTMTEAMYSDMQSNIDYLMLLNDADSVTEEETE